MRIEYWKSTNDGCPESCYIFYSFEGHVIYNVSRKRPAFLGNEYLDSFNTLSDFTLEAVANNLNISDDVAIIPIKDLSEEHKRKFCFGKLKNFL